MRAHGVIRCLDGVLHDSDLGAVLAEYLTVLDSHRVGSPAETRAWQRVENAQLEMLMRLRSARVTLYMTELDVPQAAWLSAACDREQAAWDALLSTLAELDALPGRVRRASRADVERRGDDARAAAVSYCVAYLALREACDALRCAVRRSGLR